MNLLVTFTYNVSLERYYEYGTIYREIAIYKELAKKNINIEFLTYGNQKEFEYSKLLEPIKIFPISKFIQSKIHLFKHLKILILPFKLKNLFHNVDLIKTIQVYGSWIACIAKILYGKKIIIRSGFEWLSATKNVIEKKGFRNYIRYLLRYSFIFINELISYKLADGIILTSDYDIPFVLKYYRLKKKYKNNKICLIYNFIDEEIFKPIPMIKKDKHILFIGNLHRGKNVMNLVEAFKDIKEFTLDIIGKGPDEEKMKMRAEELDLNINFLGRFPNNKMPEIINQYHIFILPSISEGNPKVLLEAMSCEVACIGTNIEGINNIVRHKVNGFLCKTDPESIRNAILTVYNDDNLKKKIARNARKFILKNCSLKSIAEKEYLFYQQIMSK